MDKITSINNNLVKETLKLQQKKYRDIKNRFLLEGYKPISEAFNTGIEIDYVFVLNNKTDKYSFLGEKVIPATEAVLKKISTTDSYPEAVGVGFQKVSTIEDIKNGKQLILLENIKDPGNLGTIIRSAVAFNADGIILYGDCTDIYNPKCVRSAVGNLWKVPILYTKNIDGQFKDFQRVATLPRTNNTLKTFKRKDKILVMFGSEADGLSKQLTDYSTDTVKIEMNETVESLNLSISCAIVMYKLFV